MELYMSPSEITRIWDFLNKISDRIGALEICSRETAASIKHSENLLTALSAEYKRARECELEMAALDRKIQRVENCNTEKQSNVQRLIFRLAEWAIIAAVILLITGRL
jgi:archaellum component FlaC